MQCLPYAVFFYMFYQLLLALLQNANFRKAPLLNSFMRYGFRKTLNCIVFSYCCCARTIASGDKLLVTVTYPRYPTFVIPSCVVLVLTTCRRRPFPMKVHLVREAKSTHSAKLPSLLNQLYNLYVFWDLECTKPVNFIIGSPISYRLGVAAP